MKKNYSYLAIILLILLLILSFYPVIQAQIEPLQKNNFSFSPQKQDLRDKNNYSRHNTDSIFLSYNKLRKSYNNWKKIRRANVFGLKKEKKSEDRNSDISTIKSKKEKLKPKLAREHQISRVSNKKPEEFHREVTEPSPKNQLRITAISRHNKKSYAILQEKRTGVTYIVGKGEEIKGYKVLKIQQDKIILQKEGKSYLLSLMGDDLQ